MPPLTPAQNELLRKATLHALAIRHPTALPAPAIRSRLVGDQILDFPVDDKSLESALLFLENRKLLQFITDDMGTTRYWTATAAGVLADERGVGF